MAATDRDPPRYKPLEDYGVIGDLRTVALVGVDGCIDFLCWPAFDSPTVFAALLDADQGGRFELAPIMPDDRHYQMYLPDTNVLVTRFLSEQGVAEVIDFMPVCAGHGEQALVREVRAIRGEIAMRMRLAPRFDYARAGHRVERCDGGVCFLAETPDQLCLRLWASLPVDVRGPDAWAEFSLHAGQRAWFVLERARPGQETRFAAEHAVQRAFEDTVDFWRQWLGSCLYHGRWRETVHRSALVLKLLISNEHGSMVAAPTFGIPERIQGKRNWDYRYTWIRDSSFMLKALGQLGFHQETARFVDWIENVCSGVGQDVPMHVMYSIDGSYARAEEELAHLEGYRGTKPVLIGNGARTQLQLDIYGELLDALELFDRHSAAVHHDFWDMLVRMVDWVSESWRRPDNGIWEARTGCHEFLHSRVMCWVALERALRLARRRSLPAPMTRWGKTRNAIYQYVHETLWDPELGAFVLYPGADALDAACLMMPLAHFISPTDPRWLSTLRVVEERLVEDSLVYRYRQYGGDESFLGGEGTFSACTFWFAECLAMAGQVDHGRLVFEKMLGYANHLGLFGEELSPRGEHLGNFPQAFTHLALINAAIRLDHLLGERRRP